MKIKSSIYILSVSFIMLGLLILSACHSYGGPDNEGIKLTVKAEIEQQDNSKAQSNSWSPGDRIGISSDLKEDNVIFTTSGDGSFSSALPVYILGGRTVTYTAYYPHSPLVSSSSPVLRFTEPVNFMWASATATREEPTVNLVFRHLMSSISVTIKDDAPSSSIDRGTIRLEGVRKGGEFHTLEGTVTSDAPVSTISAEFTLGETVRFILPPHRPDDSITVIVELDGKSYTGEFNIDNLAEGKDYRYTIDMTNASKTGQFSISSATIQGWTSNDGGEIIMDHV